MPVRPQPIAPTAQLAAPAACQAITVKTPRTARVPGYPDLVRRDRTSARFPQASPKLRDEMRIGPCDLPPLKWSSLRYVFAMKEDDNGEEETHGGRDRCEAAAG